MVSKKMFYVFPVISLTSWHGQFGPQGHGWQDLCKGPLDNKYCYGNYWSTGHGQFLPQGLDRQEFCTRVPLDSAIHTKQKNYVPHGFRGFSHYNAWCCHCNQVPMQSAQIPHAAFPPKYPGIFTWYLITIGQLTLEIYSLLLWKYERIIATLIPHLSHIRLK